MAAVAVLREEERVSREACTFLFFGTLVLPHLYSTFLIYRSLFFDILAGVLCVDA